MLLIESTNVERLCLFLLGEEICTVTRQYNTFTSVLQNLLLKDFRVLGNTHRASEEISASCE